MFSVWTQHLNTPEEKEEFRKTVESSKDVLRRLSEILDEEEKHLTASELAVVAYDSPSWAFMQADKNGYRRALKVAKRIIDLDQKDKHQ